MLDQRLLHRGQSPRRHLSDHTGTLISAAGCGIVLLKPQRRLRAVSTYNGTATHVWVWPGPGIPALLPKPHPCLTVAAGRRAESGYRSAPAAAASALEIANRKGCT